MFYKLYKILTCPGNAEKRSPSLSLKAVTLPMSLRCKHQGVTKISPTESEGDKKVAFKTQTAA